MPISPIRLQLAINGSVIATAGFEKFGVLSGILTWVRRNPEKISEKMRQDPKFSEEEFLREKLDVNLGGLDSVTDQHTWWATLQVKAGDVVEIRVLGEGEFEEAARRQPDPVIPRSEGRAQ